MDKPVHPDEHFFAAKTDFELIQQNLLEHEFEMEIDMLRKEPLQPRPKAIARLLECILSQEPLAEHF